MFSIQNVLIPTAGSYATVDVQVENDRIVAIAPNLSPAPTPFSGQDKLLLPGFVNAHTHSSQIWQRGLVPQLPLELWLTYVMDANEAARLEDFYLGALSTAVDTLLSGGTCVIDHSYLLPGHELETVAALAKAYKQAGIRAFIAPLIQDQSLGSGLPLNSSLSGNTRIRPAAELLALMEEIVQQFHQPELGINIALGPTGFHRCSDELFEGCVELSVRHNLCRHTHLLETKAQRLLAQQRYGMTAVQRLQQLGFLDRRTSLAHGVWLGDEDIQILAETGSTVVHNPVSNLRLGSGIAPILKYLRAGVSVAFGCDGAASNDAQDLLEAIKLGTILHTVTDPEYRNWLTPRQAIEMATRGGANAVNLSQETGSLEVGKKADFVLYDLTDLSFLPSNDPIQTLVLGRAAQAIDSIWINGRQIMAEGTLLTVKLDELRQEMRDRSRSYQKPAFKTIHQLEPQYREVLRQY
jgi:cytosine/adenosine deaminase-related metal-dependent hydrolase